MCLAALVRNKLYISPESWNEVGSYGLRNYVLEVAGCDYFEHVIVAIFIS